MPSGLVVMDPALNMRMINKALQSMFNLDSAESFVGQPVSQLFGASENLTSVLENVLKDGETRSGLPFRAAR